MAITFLWISAVTYKGLIISVNNFNQLYVGFCSWNAHKSKVIKIEKKKKVLLFDIIPKSIFSCYSIKYHNYKLTYLGISFVHTHLLNTNKNYLSREIPNKTFHQFAQTNFAFLFVLLTKWKSSKALDFIWCLSK